MIKLNLKSTTGFSFDVEISGTYEAPITNILPVKIKGKEVYGFAYIDNYKGFDGLYIPLIPAFFSLDNNEIEKLKDIYIKLPKEKSINDKIFDHCSLCGKKVPFHTLEYDSNYGYLCFNCQKETS